VTLTTKEQQRLLVIGRVDRGDATAAQTAEVLGLSERQVRRILTAYRKEGAAALAHGNRGRTPAHAIGGAVRQQVLASAQTRYPDLNDTHLTPIFESTLHVEQLPFFDVLAGDLGEFVPADNRMELGRFLAIDDTVSGQTNVRNGLPRAGVPQFSIAGRVADQNDFIDFTHIVYYST